MLLEVKHKISICVTVASIVTASVFAVQLLKCGTEGYLVASVCRSRRSSRQ